MIRAFRLRDGPRFLAAVREGVYLDERAARVDRFHPVEAAMVSLFFPDLASVLTLTDRPGSRFLQLRHRPRGDEGRLLFLAPAPGIAEPEALTGWEAVFHAVVDWAAAHGMRRLVVEVAPDERWLALLRRWGFQRTRCYAVWSGPAEAVERAFALLAGRKPAVPVSPWALYRGSRGAWIEELRSTPEDPSLTLAQALSHLGTRWRHPVYVQVRWETPERVEALRALGFRPAFTLWRMVRWIAIPLLLPAVQELEAGAPASPALHFPTVRQILGGLPEEMRIGSQ